ncbi:MAG: threonine synthase [Hyphomicrobiales bacterium]|nr:threonine synthase [Hyphomicrobiales bacterium]MDE2113514.1 threonine synthase [Hyphomicrobiales bacterium]
MQYISTRGQAPELSFSDAMLAGLARDGGLYMPRTIPQLDATTLKSHAGLPFTTVAQNVMTPFIGDSIAAADLEAMIGAAYAPFRHSAVTPLVQIDDNLFVLELFHGPTLAFKDVAMQLLGRLMDHELRARGQRATIVGATSGDTGAAAIEAFAGLGQVDVFILFPNGRVSEVQRRQMTCVDSPNVHAIAVDGTFDDCQAIIKGLFNHHAFADRVGLSGINSINWARVMAQISYYFTSAAVLGSPHRKISYCVPTGNFGDILAGYIAGRMGLPIERLTIATNANDILARTLESGTYAITGVAATQSPSMDIQISSNFERLLFEVQNRDADTIRAQMATLAQSRSFTLPQAALANIRKDFDAATTFEPQTTAEISDTYHKTGYILDPHTAVAVSVARRQVKKAPHIPVVTLGTAHPAKFPDAVEAATGVRPGLPPHLADLLSRREHVSYLPADAAKVERFIEERLRK